MSVTVVTRPRVGDRAAHVTRWVSLAAGLSVLFAWGCEISDSLKSERDIRSELGADVAVSSGTVYDTNAHEWRTTVSVHVRSDAGTRPELREGIDKIVRRDFRSHVVAVRFD